MLRPEPERTVKVTWADACRRLTEVEIPNPEEEDMSDNELRPDEQHQQWAVELLRLASVLDPDWVQPDDDDEVRTREDGEGFIASVNGVAYAATQDGLLLRAAERGGHLEFKGYNREGELVDYRGAPIVPPDWN